MERLQRLLQSEPLNKIPAKDPENIRFLTFNINGSKTLFKYHPWNSLQNSYDDFLACLDADIISLQELKVQLDSLNLLGLLKNYRAFISVPKSKKGYSGVVLYVRRPRHDDTNGMKQYLTVVKAEEGMTGRLPSGISGTSAKSPYSPYFMLPDSIGGYLDAEEMEEMGINEQYLESLDSEGRCVVVELANNLVVFSLYCPANSMGTEDGERFRLMFLDVLLRRCQKLKKLGKDVVIMGDINVSMDLIDNAEGINVGIKQKKVVNNLGDGLFAFEQANMNECLKFRTSAPQRTLLNKYTYPTLDTASLLPTQFLYDTTRIVQKRRLTMYSVWNTMTNARQSNYGSRIDLILVSCSKIAHNLVKADILPYLYGSDHCPVFTDINTSYQEERSVADTAILPFEAKTFYKLVVHRDISSMFGAIKNNARSLDLDLNPDSNSDQKTSVEPFLSLAEDVTSDPNARPESKRRKIAYSSRKRPDSQQLIKSFFFTPKASETKSSSEAPKSTATAAQSVPGSVKLRSIADFASFVYNDPPKCRHGEDCCLKTSLTKESKGKKFWCCARTSKGNSGTLGEHRCDYFEWAKVNKKS